MASPVDLLHRHLSFANVLSALALFIALGGGSYAAVSTGKEGPPQPAADQGAATEPPSELPSAPATEPAPVQPQATPPAAEEEPPPPPAIDRSLPPQVEDPAPDQSSARSFDDPDEEGERSAPAPRQEGKARGGGGPPPWAPAHGWRCKQAGHAPGSPAFRHCVQSRER